jgi:Asp/Glu/hydantoin racemase
LSLEDLLVFVVCDVATYQ